MIKYVSVKGAKSLGRVRCTTYIRKTVELIM